MTDVDNYWFVYELEEGDEFYRDDRKMYGVALQLAGLIAPISMGFLSVDAATDFMRMGIVGAGIWENSF